MKQTINYKFNKPDLTDVVDIEVLNTNMDTIDLELNKKSDTGHTHTKSQIIDFPTSLPANGGNATTVGGFTVGINVPENAKFTDTVYTHPSTHPASMITGLPTSLPANGGNSDTVDGKHASDFANASHTQSASTITAGTFGGQVVTPAGTDYTTARIRNVVVLPKASEPADGSASTYPNGTITFVKKA